MDSRDATERTVALLRDAAQAMRSVTMSPCERARALVAARNSIDAQLAVELAEIDETKTHEAEGAASVATWAARELHQDPGTTRQMVRAAKTMRHLPTVGAAAHAGRVSVDHVHACTYGLKHVGYDQTVALEPEVLDVALDHTPREVFNLMRYAKAIIHSDKLDEAWLNGMDKEDFRVLRVGDGFQPDGFLDPDIGAKLKAFLTAAAVPRDGDDDRTAAQRRIDALDELSAQPWVISCPHAAPAAPRSMSSSTPKPSRTPSTAVTPRPDKANCSTTNLGAPPTGTLDSPSGGPSSKDSVRSGRP
jgi:hypothetical protein